MPDAQLQQPSIPEMSAARIRSCLEHTRDGLITATRDHHIAYVNSAMMHIFGYTLEEMVGQHLSLLFPDPARANDEFIDLIEQKALGSVVELEGRRKNGQVFPFEISLFDFSSATTREIAGYVRDLTERRGVERLKNEFVSTVSHELRTPLASIRGSLGLIASGALGPLSDQIRELVEVAERNSLRLITLINDILDLEKLASGRMEMRLEAFPLSQMINRSLEAVSGMAEAEAISLVAHTSSATVFGDSGRLTQVLVNLLSNAVKFSPPGSEVTISTREGRGYVEVRVRDRGTGIPRDSREAIFERFKQLEGSDARHKGGSGLGLAICKAVIEQHGGEIGVASREGCGSVFWFRVPADAGSQRGAVRQSKTSLVAAEAGGR